MSCRATQDGRVVVESSGKTQSAKGENGNPLQNSCLENLIDSMKRQRDMTPEDEPIGSEGFQNITGEEQRALLIASLVAQMVKNLPAMQETWTLSLGWEDPLEERWQPTPVFLPGISHGQRSLVGYSPWSCKESDTTEQLITHSKKE